MTLSELKDLPDERLNEELARLNGWVRRDDGEGYAEWQLGKCKPVQVMFEPNLDKDADRIIPDYARDLNEVAKVEKSLSGHGMPCNGQASKYHRDLIDVCITVEPRCLPTFAEPRQRTIALILTLSHA